MKRCGWFGARDDGDGPACHRARLIGDPSHGTRGGGHDLGTDPEAHGMVCLDLSALRFGLDGTGRDTSVHLLPVRELALRRLGALHPVCDHDRADFPEGGINAPTPRSLFSAVNELIVVFQPGIHCSE